MSMNAVFIQVTPDELARIEKVPALAESLFQPGVASPLAAFGDLSKKMEDRIRAAGPQLLGQALEIWILASGSNWNSGWAQLPRSSHQARAEINCSS